MLPQSQHEVITPNYTYQTISSEVKALPCSRNKELHYLIKRIELLPLVMLKHFCVQVPGAFDIFNSEGIIKEGHIFIVDRTISQHLIVNDLI